MTDTALALARSVDGVTSYLQAPGWDALSVATKETDRLSRALLLPGEAEIGRWLDSLAPNVRREVDARRYTPTAVTLSDGLPARTYTGGDAAPTLDPRD